MGEAKYALVDFFQRDEVDIVETKDIVTDVPRSKLNAKEWNGTTQVQVLWFPDGPTGKKPPKKYIGKVLRFDDERKKLLPFRQAAEDGMDVPATGEMEYGRGKRKHGKRAASIEQSDAENSIDYAPSKKKQNKSKAAARHKAAEHVKKLLLDSVPLVDISTPTVVDHDLAADVSGDHDEADNVSTLRQQVVALQTENKCLRNTIAIMQGLPSLLQQVERLSMELKNGPHRAVPSTVTSPPARSLNLPSSPPLRVANDAFSGTCAPPVVSPFRNVTAHAGSRRRVFDYEVDEDNKVDLGYGVLADADNLQYVSRVDVKKTTYTLCELLLTKEELAERSLTGKKSNAFQDVPVKEKLDDSKVRAIIGFAMKMHPHSSEGDVKKAIAAKLNIAQKTTKSKKE